MQFVLVQTEAAEKQISALQTSDPVRYKKVLRTLGRLETNVRSPGLQTHKFHSMKGPNGEDVFEAYVEHKTPAAYRVFFFYGPGTREITILAVTPHP